MKYILSLLLLILVPIYPFSYAKYNWNNNNKFGAIGVIMITLSGVVYPIVLLFSRL